MKKLLTAVMLISMAAPALAQNSPNTTSQNGSQQNAGPQNQQTSNDTQKLGAAQKIKQHLQSAGFTDVNVVAESFVVQAKSPDGDPIVMTIGPHGMSVFEGMTAGSSGSSTTGSAGPNPSNPNSSMGQKSGTQR